MNCPECGERVTEATYRRWSSWLDRLLDPPSMRLGCGHNFTGETGRLLLDMAMAEQLLACRTRTLP